jgi:hypothetical protein
MHLVMSHSVLSLLSFLFLALRPYESHARQKEVPSSNIFSFYMSLLFVFNVFLDAFKSIYILKCKSHYVYCLCKLCFDRLI